MTDSNSFDNITLDSTDISTIERFENNYYNHKKKLLQNSGNNYIIQNAGYKGFMDVSIQTSIIEEINFCIDKMDKVTIEKIITDIDKDAIKKYKMPTTQTPTTQTPTTQTQKPSNISGGNNNKILKKNRVRLYNQYLLSQDQNNLSYKIKKKLDKKISELKNFEGGVNDFLIKQFVDTLKSKEYMFYSFIKEYIEDNKILDYLKIYNIIDGKILNKDYFILFHNSDKKFVNNIIKSIVEYYFKLIMESIKISEIINEIKTENNEGVINFCPNKTIDNCFKSLLKNKMTSNKEKYKDIYKDKKEQIITIIIFILIYIFNINNTINIISFFNRTTYMYQGKKLLNRLLLPKKNDKIEFIDKIFNNKNFFEEYNNFLSKNDLIKTIIPEESKNIFNEKYKNLIKKTAEEAAAAAAKEAERNRTKGIYNILN